MSTIENAVPDSATLSAISTVETAVVEASAAPERPHTLHDWLSPDPASTSVVEAILGESLAPPKPSTAREALRELGIELVPREELTPVMLECLVNRITAALSRLGIELGWYTHLRPHELYEKLYVLIVIDGLGVPRGEIAWTLDMIDVTRSDELRIWMEFYAPEYDALSSSDTECV